MNATSSNDSPILRAQGISKRVASPEGALDILTDITFDLPRGETLAVLGASGSGKSTLLGILAGLDEASGGRVWLDGHALDEMNEDGRAALRRDGVGFVFQSFNLIPALTALENVMAPLELQRRGDARERAAAFLDTVGLSHRLSHTPSRLSGGEQQRVAIARAFAGGPKLVFADEPTGNLDQETGRKVIDLLLGINRDQGTTLVLVTHDPALADRCSQRLQLEGGRAIG